MIQFTEGSQEQSKKPMEELKLMENLLKFIMKQIQLKLVGVKLELTIFASQLEFSSQRKKEIFISKEEPKKVILSAPPKDNSPIYVVGVNHNNYKSD